MNIFSVIFYQPIFNLLVYLYNVIPGHDLGLAIIALTLIIRLILYWPSKKSIVSQKELASLQPEIDALKEKYRDDKDKLGPEMMALYKRKKINPFSSCLPMLIQLPFLFAIYRVFYNGLTKTNAMSALYGFVANPGPLNTMAFGFFDLAKKSIFVAVLAGLAQFWQSKMMMGKKKQTGMAGAMGSQMTYMMPVITIIIGAQFPAGLTFYWLLTTLFSVVQQYIVLSVRKRKTAIEVIEHK